MKKPFFLCILAFAFSLPSFAAIQLSDGPYSVDTIYCYPAGPGTTYTQVRLKRLTGTTQRLDCYILQVERKADYVSTHTVLANDSVEKGERPSAMAQRKSGSGHVYFAGTNGDWWSTSRPGVPEGAFVTEGTIAITPWNGRATLAMCAIDAEDSLYFGHDFFTDVYVRHGSSSMRCSHVNDLRYADELVLYNHLNGTITHTDASGTELRCRLAEGAVWATNTQMQVIVEQVRIGQGGSALDASHVVLSGLGAARTFLEQFAAGDTLTLDISASINGVNADFRAALGGQDRSFILHDGVVDNNWDERHPRTGLGFSQTGDTIIHCVVDGRGASAGVSTGDLAEIMRFFGAWNAMNMEGGGSSTMYVRGMGTMNRPSDGTERAESQGIFCVSSAPDDDRIAAIAPYRPTLFLPRYGVAKPDFIGYNQYGILLEKNLQGVVLSCDPSVGYINADGAFVCLGEGVLHAAYGAVTADVPVRFASGVEVAFRLDSVLISAYRPYQVEITTHIGNDTIFLQPDALTWESLDPDLVDVTGQGVLQGALHDGRTLVVGTLGDFSDTLIVRVENPTDRMMIWNDFGSADDWTVTSTSGFNPSLDPVDCPDPVTTLGFTYKTGRSPFIRLGRQAPLWSLPDSIIIPFTSDAVIEKVAVGLRANNQTQVTNFVTTEPIVKDQRYVISIAVDSLLGTDQAIFPVWFDYLRFPISTTTTAGDHYINLEGIRLIYDLPVTALDEPVVPSARKIIEDGQLFILKDGRKYNALGQLVR